MGPIFDSRRFSSLRLSVAGRGLPERLRTTAFAFLGLTAAAGLVVVAMLAQAGLPLLSPAPLPSAPVQEASVAEAVTLGQGPGAAANRRHSSAADAGSRTPDGQGSGRGSGADSTGEGAPAAVESPASVPATEAGGGDGSTGGAPAGKPKGTPPPAATPSPAGAPAPSPAPAPEPKATPSSTTPEGPGNSSSTAAAEHASERGIEASSSHLDSADGRGNAAAVSDRGQ